MAIIEFAGIPRSGKTTTAKRLALESTGFIVHQERFDLIPEEYKGKPFEYNLWYAQFCVNRLKDAANIPGTHLYERGIIDRIAYGKANFYHNRFNQTQLNEYLAVLKPHILAHDLAFVFNIDPDVSHERAVKSGEHITRDPDFLKCLHRAYQETTVEHSKTIAIPSNTSLTEIYDFVQRNISLISNSSIV